LQPSQTVTGSERRRAGILLPLFACPSRVSWGIGEIGDVAPITKWLSSAGQRVLQLLPLNEMAPGHQSPYTAISAMAIDPIFISVSAVPDFQALGGEAAMSAADRSELAAVRAAPHIGHKPVRRLKQAALTAAFDCFMDAEWPRDSERARMFKSFVSEQAWWVEPYALFRAIHAHRSERPWTEWPVELRRLEPVAIDSARRELSRQVRFYQYLQWLAATQWQEARRAAREATPCVGLFGDLPFMVDGDSADVWARQREFRFDASTGAPPDAFSATGQDWGVPLYDWDAVAADDFRWLRERARRNADLYDGYRIDHLVGFYRTYGHPRDGSPGFFTPADEPAQLALGERVLDVFRSAGAEIVAEDLGTVPDAVRASLARLGVPGFRVLRWEREWHTDGQPFRDPARYPPASVATSGTHDTEPLVVWWETASDDERRKVAAVPTIQQLAPGNLADSATAAACDVLLEALFASGSDLVLAPVQDVFGWRDRINVPATISDSNWTFRLPWFADELDDVPEARDRRDQLRAWSEKHGRAG
jgi:4-alpha-glucanotransferase